MNIAVILAGGVGYRLGYAYPKQFFKVAGKTIIEHTIDAFEMNAAIDEIAVVIHEQYVSDIERYVLDNAWKKVRKILIGGRERYHSSLVAINAYSENPDNKLIFHDAVRPLISQKIINDTVKALHTYNAVDVAIIATDTIIRVDAEGKFIAGVPDRAFLRRGQTPQAFNLGTIKKAYEIALKDPDFKSSDDCGTVVKYLPEEKVYVVQGDESNMKLTYEEDSYLLDKLFQLRSFSLYETVDFSALQNKVLVVFGGNSGIGEEIVKIASKHHAAAFSFSRSTTETDITDRISVRRALAEVYKETDKIDYVVNCAALLVKEPLLAMEQESVARIIETNYNGAVNIALESYQYLKETQGQLLYFTSSSYTRGRSFYSIYSSTKAAVVNFMQAMAQEWEPAKVRVNVINPERTLTPMRYANFGHEPENSLLKPEDVAEMSVKTLLSDFTGQVVDVKLNNHK